MPRARWYHGWVSEITSDIGAAYREVLEAAETLVKQAAHPKKHTISVSREVAVLLERAGAVAAPPVSDFPAHTEIEALREEVSQCRKCPLCESRTRAVFGAGNPNADVVFVGEAPGENEDLQGRPFVGRAGQLLTDIIEKGMKMTADVFIWNVLK